MSDGDGNRGDGSRPGRRHDRRRGRPSRRPPAPGAQPAPQPPQGPPQTAAQSAQEPAKNPQRPPRDGPRPGRRRSGRPQGAPGGAGAPGDVAIPPPPRVPSRLGPPQGRPQGAPPPPATTRAPPPRASQPPPRASQPPPRASQPPPRASQPPPPPKGELPYGRRVYLPLSAPEPTTEDELGPDFPEYAWPDGAWLANVAIVRGDEAARPLACDVGALPVRKGDTVVMDGERGPTLALVTAAPRRQLVEERHMLRAMRIAGESDLRAESRTRLREAEALRVAGGVVRALDLPAKVVRAETTMNGGRTVIYVASEERIELRDLVRQLASAFRGRVEVRHVGVRDAAKALGGVGPCGLQLCCNTFLADFAPVSIRQAKDQGLALNPQRVSGVCGRLMCCLVYEDAFYRQQRALFPKQGKRVATPKGEGRVRDLDVLARTVRVIYPDNTIETFSVDEVQALTGPLAQGAGPRAAPDEDGGGTPG